VLIAVLLVTALTGCITINPPPLPTPDGEPPVVEPTDEVPVEEPEEPEEPTPDPVEEPEEPEEPETPEVPEEPETPEEPEEPEEPTPDPCTPCDGARINHESERCYAVGETLPSGCIVAARGWFDCPHDDGSRYIVAATRQWCDPEPAPKPEATSRWACDPKCPCYGARVHGTRPGVCPQCYQIGATTPSGCVVIARGWFKCVGNDGSPFLLKGNRQWVDPDPAPKPNIDPQPIELLPEIASFTAEPMVIHDGDEVILRFDIRGASSANLTYGEYAYGSVTEPISGQNQKTIRPTGDGCATIRARNTAGEVEARVCVEIQCRHEWVPEIRDNPPSSECPNASYSGWMAYQRFEHGVMIWSEATDKIYVLYDRAAGAEVGFVQIFQDEFDEGEPESDPSLVPPGGLFQPIRGFGLVWRTGTSVRDRLGWAAEKERGYDGWIQAYINGKYFSGGLIKSIDGTIYNITWLYQYWRTYVP
jgi:hypothetical protein